MSFRYAIVINIIIDWEGLEQSFTTPNFYFKFFFAKIFSLKSREHFSAEGF